MEQKQFTNNLIAWSAVATIGAGVIHLVIVPEHWAHAPAHGLFFLLVGILQIVWGIAVWRKPSVNLYYIGVLMAGWLIVLYGLTRWFPAPFGHGPESISAIDLVCKLCEAIGMVTLALLLFQGLVLRANPRAAVRALLMIVFASVIVAFATYGVARAAEPVLPFLSVSIEEQHHDESTTDAEHDHEDVAPSVEHDD